MRTTERGLEARKKVVGSPGERAKAGGRRFCPGRPPALPGIRVRSHRGVTRVYGGGRGKSAEAGPRASKPPSSVLTARVGGDPSEAYLPAERHWRRLS